MALGHFQPKEYAEQIKLVSTKRNVAPSHSSADGFAKGSDSASRTSTSSGRSCCESVRKHAADDSWIPGCSEIKPGMPRDLAPFVVFHVTIMSSHGAIVWRHRLTTA
eukprot:CAMPEP_0181231454 /NCGR_PEP_ID=MMETSP1096-20121128/35111_1 /TAXON_ID=156174 ORGANISM="Chrysochromulina ericina, Strain CCMP281" /NCGR_SAMPLE_ID=MMETSP1096 /ASSEMBLY_ACC=CAM_ASM_000453 /LENGTH=106 /DNA_ID=CAMNT_0023325489 /DNA_START=471 /DNA_END=792 /DNA_ORIENTATION=-